MTDRDSGNERRAWRTEEEWGRLRERVTAGDAAVPHGRRRRVRNFAVGCVIAAAAAGVVALVTRPRGAEPATERTMRTAAGERLVVELSDSSTVTLAPETTLRITESRTRREVQLDGLADFRVVHDTARPFIVRARNAEATDVGTEFIVRAYSDEATVRVAVMSGVVSLANRLVGGQRASLRAGDVGTVDSTHAPQTSRPDHAAEYTSWVSGGLTFENQPLSVVAAELDRWFDVDITIDDPAVRQRRVSAVYYDPRLTDVLDALSATLSLRYSRKGRTITLRAAGA